MAGNRNSKLRLQNDSSRSPHTCPLLGPQHHRQIPRQRTQRKNARRSHEKLIPKPPPFSALPREPKQPAHNPDSYRDSKEQPTNKHRGIYRIVFNFIFIE